MRLQGRGSDDDHLGDLLATIPLERVLKKATKHFWGHQGISVDGRGCAVLWLACPFYRERERSLPSHACEKDYLGAGHWRETDRLG